MSKRDPLFEIFDRQLRHPIQEDEAAEDLILNVVTEYLLYLMELGNIPQNQLDNLEADLRGEVTEIYKKTTYGFLTLKHFRESKNMFEKLRKKPVKF